MTERRLQPIRWATAALVVGGCSLSTLVGENPAPDAGTFDASPAPDLFVPPDVLFPPDQPSTATDAVGPMDVVGPMDATAAVDLVEIDAGAPDGTGRSDDMPSRPTDRGRPDAEPAIIDVGPPDAATGADADPAEDVRVSTTPCALDRDCIGERVPSRCHPVLMLCVAR